MSDQNDNTAFQMPNHPFYIEVRYAYSLPVFYFYNDRIKAELLVEAIVAAIEKERRMFEIERGVFISIENVLKVRVIEKGMDIDDLKWLG